MPVVSKKMTSNGEAHRRYLERNERKEILMALKFKKKEKAEEVKEEKKEKKEKGSTAPKTPVPPADRDGDRYGKSWGLKLNETFIRLLTENEDPKKGHKDDEQLMQFLLAEFPNRHNKGILYNIREIRWRYNFGRFTSEDGRTPPDLISQKYDENGNVFERTKVTKTGMSPEEAAMKLEDRKKKEAERREEEDAAIAKSQERHYKLIEKINVRRENWEQKNGPLQDNQPVAKKKLKKVS